MNPAKDKDLYTEIENLVTLAYIDLSSFLQSRGFLTEKQNYSSYTNLHKNFISHLDSILGPYLPYLLDSARTPFQRGEHRWNIYTAIVEIRDRVLEKMAYGYPHIAIKEEFNKAKQHYKYLVKYDQYYEILTELSEQYLIEIDTQFDGSSCLDFFNFLYHNKILSQLILNSDNYAIRNLLTNYKGQNDKHNSVPLEFTDWMNLLKHSLEDDFYSLYKIILQKLDDYVSKNEQKYYQMFRISLYPRIFTQVYDQLNQNPIEEVS